MAKPLVEKTRTVRMQPFPYRVCIIVTSDVNRSIVNREKLVGQHEPNASIVALQCEAPNGGGMSYIFLPLKCDVGTICHESYHAVRSMLRFVGSQREEELVAYHLGDLARAMHKLVSR